MQRHPEDDVSQVTDDSYLAERIAATFQVLEDTMQEFTDSANMLREVREKVLLHSNNVSLLVKKLIDLAPLLVSRCLVTDSFGFGSWSCCGRWYLFGCWCCCEFNRCGCYIRSV